MLKYMYIYIMYMCISLVLLVVLHCIFGMYCGQDRVGRPTEGRQIGVVDPDGSVIVLHLYCGMLKVVPLQLDSTEPLTAFNIRCVYNVYTCIMKVKTYFD